LGHGEVWWVDVGKVRPVLVLTRAAVADRLHRVLVAPITTAIRDIPVEVRLGPNEGVVEGSVANLDNVQLVPVGWLLEPAGTVARRRWHEVCAAMAHAIACD
jgi:mRNA interferase MazF